MQQSIFEAITDTPRKFWLVLDIPTERREKDDEWTVNRRNLENKILSDLAKGELEGVRGISASKEIMTDWFVNIRNATLVLDPHDLMALNDIEQVRYHDIDYLAHNNFRVLYRLFQKERSDGKLDHEQLMMNIMPYWIKGLSDVNSQAAHMLQYYGYSRVADYWEQHFDDYKITDHRRAALAIKDMWLKYNAGSNRRQVTAIMDDLTDDEIIESTKIALRKIGDTYSDEAEWIVNSSHLRIPPRSKLLVAIDPDVARHYDEWKADQQSGELPPNQFDSKWINLGWRLEHYERLIEVIREYRLQDRYDLRVVDARKFNGVELKVARRKRNERLNNAA